MIDEAKNFIKMSIFYATQICKYIYSKKYWIWKKIVKNADKVPADTQISLLKIQKVNYRLLST